MIARDLRGNLPFWELLGTIAPTLRPGLPGGLSMLGRRRARRHCDARRSPRRCPGRAGWRVRSALPAVLEPGHPRDPRPGPGDDVAVRHGAASDALPAALLALAPGRLHGRRLGPGRGPAPRSGR